MDWIWQCWRVWRIHHQADLFTFLLYVVFFSQLSRNFSWNQFHKIFVKVISRKFLVKSNSQKFLFKLLLIPRWPYHNQSVWMGLGFLCGEPFGFCWHILLKFCLLEWHINWYSGVEFFCGHFVYDKLGVFYLEIKNLFIILRIRLNFTQYSLFSFINIFGIWPSSSWLPLH